MFLKIKLSFLSRAILKPSAHKKARHFFASSEFLRILDYLSSQINEQSPR